MRKIARGIKLGVLFVGLFGIAANTYGTKRQRSHSFENYTLLPLSELNAGSATTFELSFSSKKANECGDITTITLITRTYDHVISEKPGILK